MMDLHLENLESVKNLNPELVKKIHETIQQYNNENHKIMCWECEVDKTDYDTVFSSYREKPIPCPECPGCYFEYDLKTKSYSCTESEWKCNWRNCK